LLYILKYFINDEKDCPKSNPFFMGCRHAEFISASGKKDSETSLE